MVHRALVAAGALAALAFSACSSSSTSPPANTEPTTFTLAVGATTEFLWTQTDSANHVIDSTERTIHERVVQTGLSAYGRVGVAMAVDSVWTQSRFAGLDTTYYWTDGVSLWQHGFVSELVALFSSSLIVPAKWNDLCDTSTSWITDTTAMSINGVPATERTVGQNMGITTYNLDAEVLHVRAALHQGSINFLGPNNFSFNLAASFKASAVVLVSLPPTSFAGGAYRIPATSRYLTAYTHP